MSDDEFTGFLESSLRNLSALNDHNGREFNLGNWERWSVDLDTGFLTFSEAGQARVRAIVRVVGTSSDASKTFRWGWANEHLPAAATEGMTALRDFGVAESIEPLTWDTLDEADDVEVGWEMTALAVRILNGRGCYRYPSGNGFVYLLIVDLAFVA